MEAKLNFHKLNRIFDFANFTIFLGQQSSNHKNSLHEYLRHLSSQAILVCHPNVEAMKKEGVSMEEIFSVKWKEFQGKQENMSIIINLLDKQKKL